MKIRNLFPAAALLAVVSFSGGTAFGAESQNAMPAAQPSPAAAQELSKEQAIERALKAHPGKVTKAYEDTKKGKKTWEVKIDGDDGKKWEVYYEIKTGQLVAEEGK
ncbi:MAG: PepSY domain-containing protein [Candidatus Competibacteraceae bacterium]|nr:PepSY domain-containing protein [Candidatus Competibacteraceae bacterium]